MGCIVATDLTVANEILRQLGGNRFRAMTGAKNFLGDANSLAFSIPRVKSPKGGYVNKIKIFLTSDDTYRLQVFDINVRKQASWAPYATYSDVYAEDLQTLFTEITGLDTHL